MSTVRVVATSCFLALGVPAHAIDFSLKPVSASTPHAINGNQITVFSGGGTVTLEIRVSNWDPDLDGEPLLHGYQARIDSSGYTSGAAGYLGVDRIPCSTNADCPGSACTSTSLCEADDAAWIDSSDPEFIFHGLTAFPILATYNADFLYAAYVWNIQDSVTDAGADRYAGTLVLNVSDDAFGTFEVGFVPWSRTFGFDPENTPLPPNELAPARIVVVRDCNLNGIADDQDIADGNSDDCNNNGRPDECELDCNSNGVPDDCDIASGTSPDEGGNGLPDECDPDCNGNGAADDGDIAVGASKDCNGSAIPDECEPGGADDCDGDSVSDLCALFTGSSLDCNANGIPDNCDIADDLSEDCTGNGVPDECEPDCNRNGVADVCDIAAGVSLDENGDGVPDDCFRGLALIPVAADVPHQLQGNEVIVPPGGAAVTLELRIAGWGRGAPPATELLAYSAGLEIAGFTSGAAGHLSLTALPCETSIDCFSFVACKPDGFCEDPGALFIDPGHPNAVIKGSDSIVVSVLWGDVVVMQAANLGVVDPGADRHAGAVLIDVSPDAAGTFTLNLGPSESWWDTSSASPPPAVFPAIITVLTDCNGNGIADDQDIVAGTSQDADGNGVPDECELAVPLAAGMGSRYLSIIPQAGTEPVAVYVSSAQFPCVRRYVVPGANGVAKLSDSPVFLTPDAWGGILLSDHEVVPGSAFEVQAQFTDGRRSWAATASTWRWGDADGNHRADVLDISLVVNVIKGVEGAEAGRAGANVFDCDGAGVVNVLDISGVVDAIKGRPYPCDVPCL